MATSIALAVTGSLLGFALGLLELRNVPRASRPDFKDWLYWLPVIVNPGLAAILAFVYVSSGTALSPLLALNVGVAAPVILRGMASANPFAGGSIDPGKGA